MIVNLRTQNLKPMFKDDYVIRNLQQNDLLYFTSNKFSPILNVYVV